MYEIGSCQIFDNTKYNLSHEDRYLSIIWCGTKSKHWIYPNYIDIYTIKGDINLLFKNLGFKNINYKYQKTVKEKWD